MILKIEDGTFEIIGSKPIELNVDFSYTKEEPLFETIKIKDGKIYNLEYHQARVDRSYREYYGLISKLNLKELLINIPKSGLYRAKLIYNKDGLISLDYYIYSKKIIKTLAIVEVGNINYNYKYLNREFFNTLPKVADECIILKDGYLSDTTISNIALYSHLTNDWKTPLKPLLPGTTRERYIKLKKIKKEKIHYEDLKNYSRIALLNAMIDFYLLN